jgi:hypothetical protein
MQNSRKTIINFLKCFIFHEPVAIFNSAYTEKRCSLRCDTFRHTKMRQNEGGPIPWNQGPWGTLFTKKFLKEIFEIFVLRTIWWLISVCCWHSTLPLLCLLMGAAGSGCCVYCMYCRSSALIKLWNVHFKKIVNVSVKLDTWCILYLFFIANRLYLIKAQLICRP